MNEMFNIKNAPLDEDGDKKDKNNMVNDIIVNTSSMTVDKIRDEDIDNYELYEASSRGIYGNKGPEKLKELKIMKLRFSKEDIQKEVDSLNQYFEELYNKENNDRKFTSRYTIAKEIDKKVEGAIKKLNYALKDEQSNIANIKNKIEEVTSNILGIKNTPIVRVNNKKVNKNTHFEIDPNEKLADKGSNGNWANATDTIIKGGGI